MASFSILNLRLPIATTEKLALNCFLSIPTYRSWAIKPTSVPKKVAELWKNTRIELKAIPRRNQQKQMPSDWQRLFNAIRQMIETVNAQLSTQFNIESISKSIMPIPFGACVLVSTPNWLHIRCAFTAIVCSVSPPSSKSRRWLSQSSIRP